MYLVYSRGRLVLPTFNSKSRSLNPYGFDRAHDPKPENRLTTLKSEHQTLVDILSHGRLLTPCCQGGESQTRPAFKVYL